LQSLSLCNILSDERMGLSFTTALVLASKAILRSKSRGTHNQIFLSQIRDSPNLEGQVPVFISPRNRVASYDTGLCWKYLNLPPHRSSWSSLYNIGMDCIENTASSIVSVSVAMET
jgi:hypothetical protein